VVDKAINGQFTISMSSSKRLQGTARRPRYKL